MLLLTRSLKFSLLLTIATSLLLGGCNRLQVVPEETSEPAPVEDVPVVTAPVETTPVVTTPSTGMVHIVQPKEGLYGIAQQYGLNYQTVAAWNGIAPPYIIHPGQTIRLTAPAGGVVVAPAPTTVTPAPAPTPVASGTPRYHTVQPGDTLYAVSRQYGVGVQDLIGWNELKSPYVLSVGQSLMVNTGQSGDTIMVDGRLVPLIPADQWNPQPTTVARPTHTVQAKETLYGIARRYGVTLQDLAAWNGMGQPYPPLRIGQQLVVGSATTTTASVMVPVAAPVSTTQYHSVQKGETLYRLSRQYNVSVSQLASANGMTQPYPPLSIGQRLRIPTGGGSYTTASLMSTPSPLTTFVAPAKPSKIYHTVQRGESLATIAAMYGQTTPELALWNGIAPPYNIYVGQSLLVVK